jgi:peroxiredoxin
MLPLKVSVRILPCVPSWILALALAGSLFACGEAPTETAETSADPLAATPTASAAESKPKARRERPLPNFSGNTLGGERIQASSLIGKRLLIHFFNPDVELSNDTVKAVGEISKLRQQHNFEIIGIATGSSRSKIEPFVVEHGIDFRILDDSSAAIARVFALRNPNATLLVDAEGYMVFSMQHYKTEAPDPVQMVEDKIREALRLPPEVNGNEPVLGNRPVAPLFQGKLMDGEEEFVLAEHRGTAVVVIFFLHTCPHCHDALEVIRNAIEDLPPDKRPFLIGVELSSRGPSSVRLALGKLGLDFFPIIFDRDGSIQEPYGVFGGVPDTFFIDREGRIAYHITNWGEDREPLVRMQLANLAGAPVPMMLRKAGYSGSEACEICHESEHETWLFTKHARAFDTLVKHGDSTDPECVSCHVVGYGEPGGFIRTSDTPQLENVGCEACHGPGGTHLSDEPVEEPDYEKICVRCHNPEHSLGFDFATFLPRISHAENAGISLLSLEERQALLAELGTSRNPLPTRGSYVGSDACQSCHESEYATWSADPHAHAWESLSADGETGNPECLRCHTTAYGLAGGFPKDGSAKPHPDLGRVGCESCHGPGSEHIKEDAARIGDIVSLGDKCDSCVILQICGSCHDDLNDPGFEFEVKEKIDAQRHGTTEAGTGKPKDQSVYRFQPLDVALAHSSDAGESDRSQP